MNRLARLAAALALAVVAGCAGTLPSPQNAVVKPAATTEGVVADAELLDTHWKVLSMAGEPVKGVERKREPQIILTSADGRMSWSATVGCNQMSGGLEVSGDRVEFKTGMTTLMACPSPLDMLEKQLGKSLLESTHWRILGDRLELRDSGGAQTFLCEAVYLK